MTKLSSQTQAQLQHIGTIPSTSTSHQSLVQPHNQHHPFLIAAGQFGFCYGYNKLSESPLKQAGNKYVPKCNVLSPRLRFNHIGVIKAHFAHAKVNFIAPM